VKLEYNFSSSDSSPLLDDDCSSLFPPSTNHRLPAPPRSPRRAMAAAAPPAASADDEIVYESMPCIRIYKNRVERYFGSEFVAASTDAATGVASRDVTISPNVSARLYLPRLDAGEGEGKKLPVLVYYHGGGFCLGSAFNPTFHAYFNSFAALANVLVVSVEYRLAPEHPVPAAYADSWEALAWVVSHHGGEDPWVAGHADFSRLYLGGESAGSNIAHHMAMRVGAEGLGAEIRGLVMIHPYFLGTGKVPSDDLDPAARESLGSLWRVMCPATTGEDDPLINPFVDGAPALDGLACGRVLVCIGEGDVLRDRGRAYYDRLKASGWRGEADIWQAPGKGHTFHLLEPSCDEAIAQDKVISDFLNR
jgi:acetyl esterase/lipase